MQITDIGSLNLVAAIFRCTAQDIRYGNSAAKKDARIFLESQWFEDLCEIFNVGPERTRNMILYNQIAWRSKYE